jgi:hypothetical protein
MVATNKQILDWMNENIDNYINETTGEVECTELAEATADNFGEGDIVPEIYYDFAVNVEAVLLGNSFN